MEFAERMLREHGFQVDYVVSHCLPTGAAAAAGVGTHGPDRLTDFFEHMLRDEKLRFGQWHCGHYHRQGSACDTRYVMHYRDIMRLL